MRSEVRVQDKKHSPEEASGHEHEDRRAKQSTKRDLGEDERGRRSREKKEPNDNNNESPKENILENIFLLLLLSIPFSLISICPSSSPSFLYKQHTYIHPSFPADHNIPTASGERKREASDLMILMLLPSTSTSLQEQSASE